MGDFEDRLGRALGEGAESAPGAAGLADGARTRARRRRARWVAGGAAAVVAVAVPVAVLSAGTGPQERATELPPAAEAMAQQRVTCGGPGWEVATMDGGLAGVLDEADVRAAFAAVLEEAPMDAPTAIIEDGPDEASYVVLAEAGDRYTLGIGDWSIAGPAGTAMSATLERQPDGGLRMIGWGGCRLSSELPPGRSLVGVAAPAGGVDPTTTAPLVMVSEVQCTGARDPEPFLGEPVIVADSERVLVTMTSDVVVGGADCPGNPSVPVTLTLDEPIGDRELLDAGTFPPTPIEVAAPTTPTTPGDGWQTVTYEGAPVAESGDGTILLDLPPGWELLTGRGCDVAGVRYGDPALGCDRAPAVRVYLEATLDYAGPGLSDDGGSSTGLVVVGRYVVSADGADYDTVRRILASVRLPGEEAPSTTWRTEDLDPGYVVDVPVDGTASWSLQSLFTAEVPPSRPARQTSDGSWVASVGVGNGTRYVITATTQALADVVASTVRPAAR